MQAPLRGLGLGLVMLCAGAAGFLGFRVWQHHARPNPLVGAAGASAPAPSAHAALSDLSAMEQPKPVVPDTVPDIRLSTLEGAQKSLRDYLGRPLIINFWATWCGPCRREIPLLQQLRLQHTDQRLEVVGIAVDFKSAVTRYLARVPIAYPLLVGEDQGLAAAERFGMEPVLPFSVFADAKGRIVVVKIGELHREEADFILATMSELAAGRMGMEQARAAITEKLHTLAIERAKTNINPS
jgi:thiol-disulfide isomerase/thioredoxin